MEKDTVVQFSRMKEALSIPCMTFLTQRKTWPHVQAYMQDYDSSLDFMLQRFDRISAACRVFAIASGNPVGYGETLESLMSTEEDAVLVNTKMTELLMNSGLIKETPDPLAVTAVAEATKTTLSPSTAASAQSSAS